MAVKSNKKNTKSNKSKAKPTQRKKKSDKRAMTAAPRLEEIEVDVTDSNEDLELELEPMENKPMRGNGHASNKKFGRSRFELEVEKDFLDDNDVNDFPSSYTSNSDDDFDGPQSNIPHYDEDTDPDEEFEVEHEPEDRILQHSANDIFLDRCGPMAKKGIPISYTIKRDGQWLATRPHPLTWEEIHQEFGGGNYQVLARRTDENKFAGGQSLTLAGPRKTPGYAGRDGSDIETKKDSGPTFMEMMAMMKESNKETAEKSETQSNQTMQMMMAFMSTLVNKKEDNGNPMMFEMFKMQQKSIEKIADTMNNNMEKLYERVNNKGDELGPMAMIEMMRAQEENGYKKFQTLQKTMDDTMDKKINERAKLIVAAEGGGDGEEKSMTEKLISSFAPIIANAMAKQYPQGNIANTQTRPQQLPQTSMQPRRPTPLKPNAPSPVNKPVLSPIESIKPIKVDKKDIAVPILSPVSNKVDQHPDYRPIAQVAVKPTTDIELKTPVEPITEAKIVSEQPQTYKISPEEIADIAAPLIGASLVNSESASEAASKHLIQFERMGITRNQLLENFTEQGIIELARKNKLPEFVDPWLKDYYASINKTDTGNDAARFASQS